MAAGKLKLVIEQGSTFRKKLTWRTGANNFPVDLTGCTARLQMRATVESAAVLVSLTTENLGIVLGGALGTIDLFISHTDTAALTWTEGVYDLEIVFPSTDVRRLVAGAVVVSLEVTRD